jgi:hypothetical protein
MIADLEKILRRYRTLFHLLSLASDSSDAVLGFLRFVGVEVPASPVGCAGA